MKKSILICAFLIFYFSMKGQPVPEFSGVPVRPGVISGFVHDSATNGAIEYATIGLFQQADSALVIGGVTNDKGFFEFRSIPGGNYYLEASFLGYIKKKISIVLTSQRPGADIGILVLHPDITQIGEVRVTAQSQRVEYQIDKKVVNVSQDISSAGGSLVNVLENTPSVEVDVEGNVSLRGSSNFQLLIDGKPSVVQGSEGLQQIPASAVQSLEIITSPSAKYDPDGDAGIINVIMKKQKNSGIGGIINASAGTRNKYTADFLLNFKHEKLNYFIGGEFSDMQFHNKGEQDRRTYLSDTTTYIKSDNNGVFRRKSLNFKTGFDYNLNATSTISLNGSLGNRNFRRDFTTKSNWYTLPASKDSFYIQESNAHDEDRFYNVNFDYQKNFAEKDHNLQASVYYSASSEDETEEDIIKKSDENYHPLPSNNINNRAITETPEKELRVELDYVRPMGKRGKLETGFQSRWDHDESNYIYEELQPLNADWVRNDSISNTLDYLDALQSAYLIYSARTGKFELQGGIRAEYDNRQLDQKTSEESFTYEKMHFFPSFYVTRKFSEKSQVQFTYSRRIQRPDERDLNPFREFRGVDNVFYGNPALKPEFTNAYELNYQYTFNKGFVSLETYYRNTDDKITRINGYDTISGRPVFTNTTINANKDYSLGMELMTNIDLLKWWNLNVTANFFRYKLEGQVEGEETSSVSTTWRTNFNSSFKLKWDTRVQFTGFYNGPSNTLQGQRDGFFVANLAVRKELFKKQLSVSLNARDIFSTGVFSFTSEGSSFYTSNKGRRESPVVMLNLTLRLNNYKQGNRSRGGEDNRQDMNMDEMM